MALRLLGASREALAAARERLDGLAADAEDRLAQIGDVLLSVAELLHGEGGLRRALTDPALPAPAKSRLVDRLLGERCGPATLELLRALAGSRWSRPRDLVDALDALGVQAYVVLAERAGHLDDVEDELFRFSRVLEGESALRLALADNAIPPERRVGLVHGLLQSRVHPATLRLVEEAVRSPRGRTLAQALDDALAYTAERQRQLIAEVWTAVPLTAEQVDNLSAALARLFGQQVRVQAALAPELIGGVRVRVGEQVIDGSVAAKLLTARHALAR